MFTLVVCSSRGTVTSSGSGSQPCETSVVTLEVSRKYHTFVFRLPTHSDTHQVLELALMVRGPEGQPSLRLQRQLPLRRRRTQPRRTKHLRWRSHHTTWIGRRLRAMRTLQRHANPHGTLRPQSHLNRQAPRSRLRLQPALPQSKSEQFRQQQLR